MIAMTAALVALTAAALAADETLPKLKEKAEAAHGGHRAELMLEVARREMEAADESFTNGDVEKAHALVRDSMADVEKASQAAIESGQRLKKTEMDLRKLRYRTEEIKRTLAIEDRPQFDQVEQRMDALMEALLKRLFSK